MAEYEVVKYAKDGSFVGIMSGMGEHEGTMDSTHTLTDARRHAEDLRREDPGHDYVVEEQFGHAVPDEQVDEFA